MTDEAFEEESKEKMKKHWKSLEPWIGDIVVRVTNAKRRVIELDMQCAQVRAYWLLCIRALQAE